MCQAREREAGLRAATEAKRAEARRAAKAYAPLAAELVPVRVSMVLRRGLHPPRCTQWGRGCTELAADRRL